MGKTKLHLPQQQPELHKSVQNCKPVQTSQIKRVWTSANREDEDEALDGTLPGVVSMYMCQYPLSYT